MGITLPIYKYGITKIKWHTVSKMFCIILAHGKYTINVVVISVTTLYFFQGNSENFSIILTTMISTYLVTCKKYKANI